MDEYIKRDSVIKEFTERLAKAPTGLEKVVCDMAIRIITKIPSADVQIVKHGKWEFAGHDDTTNWYRCSVCGHEEHDNMTLHDNYCCNCGSRMDGDTE